MSTNSRPFVCPVLIGRALQLDSLRRLFDEAGRGGGEPVLIAGEAGVGKSRLVAEGRALALELDFRVLQGNCFERDRSLPYSALLELLRSCFATLSSEELDDCVGQLGTEIVKIVPELALRMPGLAPSSALEPDQEKRRLFTALTQFFSRLATKQPLLAVFEDLHWSDETSLEFLLYYARWLAAPAGAQAVAVLMTYRSDEVDSVLGHFIAELDRQRLASELSLSRLTMAETDVMLRAILGLQRPVRRDFLEAIHGQTEGNPFFVEEVLKSSLAADAQVDQTDLDRRSLDRATIPRTVQDAVRQRAGALSGDARRLVTIAAVAGQRFDFDLLEALTGEPAAKLLASIRELLDAQLVVEESLDRFSFRHALTRQAIYSQLLGREQRDFHLSIANALEEIYASSPERLDAHVSELAYHFYEAQVWEKALQYSQSAGEKAQALFTPRAAVQHLSQAIEANAQLSASPPSGLLHLRARAYEVLGDFEHTLADLEAALESARLDGDRDEEWDILLDLGMTWASRDYEKTGQYYQRALELAESTDDQIKLARSLNRVGNWRVNLEQPVEALEYHERALQAFEQAEDKAGIAETLDLLGVARIIGGDLAKSRDFYERAIAQFEALDNRQGLVSSLATMVSCGGGYHTQTMAHAATLPEAARWAERALAIAGEIGWRSAESFALWNLSTCLGPQGEYDRAFDSVLKAKAIAEEIDHKQWLSASLWALGAIHLDLLGLEEGRQYVEEAFELAKETGSLHWTRTYGGFLASCYAYQGETERAEDILSGIISADTPVQTIGQRMAWTGRIELALARKDAAEALRLADFVIGSAANQRGIAIPRLVKLRGDALALDGKRAEAETDYKAAGQCARLQGARALEWRIHAATAELYLADGRRAEAEAEASNARALIDVLSANVSEPNLREAFERAAYASIPIRQTQSLRRAARETFGGLTEREREVAALVATGRSNAAIAETLVIGERTVESHVANILAKLGFASRAQIAAWAVERGLLQGVN